MIFLPIISFLVCLVLVYVVVSYLVDHAPRFPRLYLKQRAVNALERLGLVQASRLHLEIEARAGAEGELKELQDKNDELSTILLGLEKDGQARIQAAIERSVKPLEEITAALTSIASSSEWHKEPCLTIRLRVASAAVDAAEDKQKLAWLTHALAVQIQGQLQARSNGVVVVEDGPVAPEPPAESKEIAQVVQTH